MNFQNRNGNKGISSPGMVKHHYTWSCLVPWLILVSLFALSLTTISCSDSSTASQSQTTSLPTTLTPESSKSFRISGPGMEPSLSDGDKVNAFNIYRDIKRGDIVVYISPENPDYTLIKRVVGLPGETIEIKDNQVYINASILVEPYILESPSYTVAPSTIPNDYYFMLGDNRNKSNDSHNHGAVPMENIKYLVEIQ